MQKLVGKQSVLGTSKIVNASSILYCKQRKFTYCQCDCASRKRMKPGGYFHK